MRWVYTALLGFMGLYLLLGIVFPWLIWRELEHGPEVEAADEDSRHPAASRLTPAGGGQH
jgi:hypothetical protein